MDERAKEVLVFEVQGRRYGVPSAAVREIVRAVQVSPVTGAPPIVEGIIDVRGRLVPVIDVARGAEPGARPVTPSEHFVLADAGGRLVTLRADRVVGLSAVGTAFEELGRALPRTAETRLAGAVKLPDGLVLIFDLRSFLDEAEARSLDALLAARAAGGPGQARAKEAKATKGVTP